MRKKAWFSLLLATLRLIVFGQARLPIQWVTHFKTLPKTTGDIIFLANSITDGGEWDELFGLRPKPSLIPMPRQVEWKDGLFPAYRCRVIEIQSDKLKAEGNYLQKALAEKGIHAQIDTGGGKGPVIQLVLGKVPAPAPADEAYHLSTDRHQITITAGTPHGVFNGIQTLLQLLRDNVAIDACDIMDWPAFPWRGYMVDVGRNFQSVGLLKQQIDKMALYKLDVFHLHLTEDIAWRLTIKKYPQLTQPKNMLRDEGAAYSENDIREIMAYCRARHITFVPEIDMPGHSGAFRRCFSVDMQSDSGMAILKNILKEVLETYHFDYLHIGGDEVKISNPGFLSQMVRFIGQYGTKTIGWSPGGNLPKESMHQLWSAKETLDDPIQYIDSRHLYLNHMDPLESVVTIFDRQLDNVQQGDASHIGAEICLWNDRAVDKEEDLLRMNPVYPAMLAFAERSWRGGGEPGWTAVAGVPGSAKVEAFSEFETRLLDQQKESFEGLPFPYRKQADLVWALYGPYNNYGDLSKQFAPEQKGVDNLAPALKASGGTIILRHWWYPLVHGVLADPKENTTWYAATRLWSDEDKTEAFWIGFNNLSRSYSTDPPPVDHWDDKGSAIWVNGKLVSPPLWKHAGKKGNLEMALVDEGYEYRKPTLIPMRKGWNTVLVKLPVGGFVGEDWNNPVKWMFTFLQDGTGNTGIFGLNCPL
ncbi:MAG TPA: beta-N-acetylhexosaminidase [Puia sp.]|nr:beta-N-acetylhexosaminidase [Puia sp.]